MASNTAEHFVVTYDLGGSTIGERAASIAPVISDAATLTATNTAVYSAADAEELVASQTFRLTTGLVASSAGSTSFLNTLAAASLASGHRSAPRFC